VAGFLRFIRLENGGSLLGFQQGLWVWAALALAGVLLVPFYAQRLGPSNAPAMVAVGLQVGGTISNLLDRLLFGTVTDFIDIGVIVVFNPADLALVAGMCLALLLLLSGRDPDDRRLHAFRPRTLHPGDSGTA
jgi:signal peptidase II